MKTLIKIVIYALSILGFQSCNFTDLDPIEFVDEKTAFTDVSTVEKDVNGAFSLVSLRATLMLAEFIADDVIQGGQAGGLGNNSFSWTYSASTGDHNGLWERQYKVINMANRIIKFGADVPTKGNEEKALLDNYIGQAYFLRAYSHFELLRFFSDFRDDNKLGIPYIVEPHIFGKQARDKVDVCYKNIMDDLEKAYNLLSADKPSNTTYASKTAVNALRARTCLYHGKYADAQKHASDALLNVPLASVTDYPQIWADKTNAGVILKLPRSAGQDLIGGLFIGQDNSNLFSPSQEYIKSYDSNDIRKNLFCGRGPDREKNEVDIVMKYYGTTSNIGLNDEKLLRSAEMKLIEIESLARQDKINEANSELNKFRTFRITNWNDISYNKEELLEQVLLERRRELSFEGHRFFDLRRYEKDIIRDKDRILKAGDYKQIMPIPTSELEVNSGIPKSDQNPGY